MTTNGKGLGRGLDALFNNQSADEGAVMDSPLKIVPLERLFPNPDQPRKFFDEESLKELANSIRSRGILQPLLVQPANDDGNYEIIAGERRWRAAKIAGLEVVPIIIKEFNGHDTLLASLMENMHRENLNPLEEAEALAYIKDTLQLNQQDLANALGIQRGSVSNMLRILKLPDDAKKDLAEGRISAGHARCLVVLPEEAEANLRKRIIDKGLSARAAEMAISFFQTNNSFPWSDEEKGHRAYKKADPDLKKIGKEISHKYSCKATIHGNSLQGKIAFTYKSPDELRELLTKFGVSLEEVEAATTKTQNQEAVAPIQTDESAQPNPSAESQEQPQESGN